jgi:NAD(P)-dependent dehydrogenase (short-subunit alcohol dehydrogenase family)
MNMGEGKKVAVIVGASRGIGRQVAIDLARNGYAGKYIPQEKNAVRLTRY